MDGEIVARVERRRRWSAAEKAALLGEVEAAGGLALAERVGVIEIDLPGDVRIRLDGGVNEQALRRVLLAVRQSRRLGWRLERRYFLPVGRLICALGLMVWRHVCARSSARIRSASVFFSFVANEVIISRRFTGTAVAFACLPTT